MSMNIALSGLNAAALDLSVAGNNIANTGTTGFKKSRSEFVDVYTASLGGISSTKPGSGVRASQVAQQFSQGTLENTDQSLDLAVSGAGFFVLDDKGTQVYSRAGAFGADKDGYVVDSSGLRLQSFRPNGETPEDGFSQGVLTDVRIDTSQGKPRASETITEILNLDAREDPPSIVAFDPTDSLSFNKSTSVKVFDSLGKSHILTQYIVKAQLPAVNTWDVHAYIDGTSDKLTLNSGVDNSFRLEFDASGALTTAPSVQYDAFDLSNVDPTNKAADLAIELNLTDSTHYANAFSVNELRQDGLSAGQLTGINVDEEGIIFARYSNGGSIPLGQVAMARFNNPQGLVKLGSSNWAESGASGERIFGAAGGSNFGSIQAGALEASNVDMAQQLVKLIVAQRNYQANAEVISTEDQAIQSILNIR